MTLTLVLLTQVCSHSIYIDLCNVLKHRLKDGNKVPNDCLNKLTSNFSAACHFEIMPVLLTHSCVSALSILLFTVIHATVDAINNCQVQSNLHGAIIVTDQLPGHDNAKHSFENKKKITNSPLHFRP